MVRRLGGVSLLAMVALVGCGEGTEQQQQQTPGPVAPGKLIALADGWKVQLEPFEVPAGTEVMRCTTVEGIPEDALIQKTSSEQGPGGHHVVPFTSPTAKVGDVKDCTTASTMGNARFIAPPGFDGAAENLAFRIKKGQPFIIQSHYVNASTEAVSVQDSFTVVKAPEGANPRLVDFFAFTDVAFLLQPGTSELVHTCTMDKELQILEHFGHLHEYGTHYSLEHSPMGGSFSMLDDMVWEKQYRDDPIRHRFSANDPLIFREGDQIRLTCGYNNTKSSTIEFPEEMCVSFMMYLTTADRPGGFLTCGDGAPEVVD
ncbi:MAG: hypothetical protein AB2A00_43170 [Myxococcota bacterium]